MEILHCLFENLNPENVDLNIINCGIQYPNPSHKYGPIIRDHHILQYVRLGRGFYELNNKTYELGPGDLFYIPAGFPNSYRSDPDDPYYYTWVGFNGAKATKYIRLMGLSAESPVIRLHDDSVHELLLELISEFEKNTETSKVCCMSTLYGVFAKLLKNVQSNNTAQITPSSEYVQKALAYIHQNFTTEITVSQLSGLLSLNRTYFSGIFKKIMGIAPVEYLIQYRIKHACRLLRSTSLSVADIATSVGFSGLVNFSIRFKQAMGCSPQAYRKEYAEIVKN